MNMLFNPVAVAVTATTTGPYPELSLYTEGEVKIQGMTASFTICLRSDSEVCISATASLKTTTGYVWVEGDNPEYGKDKSFASYEIDTAQPIIIRDTDNLNCRKGDYLTLTAVQLEQINKAIDDKCLDCFEREIDLFEIDDTPEFELIPCPSRAMCMSDKAHDFYYGRG